MSESNKYCELAEHGILCRYVAGETKHGGREGREPSTKLLVHWVGKGSDT
jgi:hypothetical protein